MPAPRAAFAMRRFPSIANELRRKTDHGRAEALLIASKPVMEDMRARAARRPPAPDMADQSERDIDDALGEAAAVHQLTRQHEEGDGQQRKAVGTFHHVLSQDLGLKHIQVPHQCCATQQQGIGNGDAHSHCGQ